MVYVKIKLEENGKLPEYAEGTPAGMDCFASETVIIEPGERKLVKLGFRLEIPNGWEVKIFPRSGMTKRGIDVGIGTIDSDYRGIVHAQLINNSKETYTVVPGAKICQIQALPVNTIKLNVVNELNETVRGEGGFGHTGF